MDDYYEELPPTALIQALFLQHGFQLLELNYLGESQMPVYTLACPDVTSCLSVAKAVYQLLHAFGIDPEGAVLGLVDPETDSATIQVAGIDDVDLQSSPATDCLN